MIDRSLTAQIIDAKTSTRTRLLGRGVARSGRGLARGAEPGQKQDGRVVARTFVSLCLGVFEKERILGYRVVDRLVSRDRLGDRLGDRLDASRANQTSAISHKSPFRTLLRFCRLVYVA